MSVPIETERLVLRKFLPSDAENMFRLDTDKEVHRYLGNRMNTSIDDARKNIDYIIQQYNENGIGRWAAIEKSSGKFIGWSGLKLNTELEMNGYNDFYDIGYRFLPEFWGKGYATESSKATLDYGFNVLNLDTIYGITHINNEASHKVLLKIGLDLINTFELKGEDFLLRWYQLKSEDYGSRMS
ncbi:Protein N-acetyltransferase, RimJ/RimL family [Flavobacteriaceae bacterium MAR_2010_188]|nr:Protein N-acetyltransferase, RimJ/RimL family [Flavobacteriaceae bacterium MAR_2010_188]